MQPSPLPVPPSLTTLLVGTTAAFAAGVGAGGPGAAGGEARDVRSRVAGMLEKERGD